MNYALVRQEIDRLVKLACPQRHQDCLRNVGTASEEIIACIEAGATRSGAVLAHPYLIDEMDAGLDGMGARYTKDKTSDKGTQTAAEIASEITVRYSSRVSFLSGGSDYHKTMGRKARRRCAHWAKPV